MICIIFGPNGFGKSSLMTYFLNESAFNYQRIREGLNEIRRMNAQLGLNIPEAQHFTYLNGESTFRKFGYSPRKGLILEPSKLGIQSEAPEGKKCQFVLPYGTLGVDEAQTYFPSRDGSDKLENYVFSFFEKHRHNDLDIYLTTTRAKLIDLRIRALSCGMNVNDRHIWYDKNEQMHIDWFVDYIKPGDIDAYLDCAPKDRKKYASYEKISCPYNVYRLYNPKSCKRLFYEGFDANDYKFTYAN